MKERTPRVDWAELLRRTFDFEESKGWHYVEYDAGTGDFLGITAVPGGELRVAGGSVQPAAPKCSAAVGMDYAPGLTPRWKWPFLGQEVPPPEKRPARPRSTSWCTIVLTYKGFDGSERHLSLEYPAFQGEGYTFGYAGLEGPNNELIMRSSAASRLPEDEESCDFGPG